MASAMVPPLGINIQAEGDAVVTISDSDGNRISNPYGAMYLALNMTFWLTGQGPQETGITNLLSYPVVDPSSTLQLFGTEGGVQTLLMTMAWVQLNAYLDLRADLQRLELWNDIFVGLQAATIARSLLFGSLLETGDADIPVAFGFPFIEFLPLSGSTLIPGVPDILTLGALFQARENLLGNIRANLQILVNPFGGQQQNQSFSLQNDEGETETFFLSINAENVDFTITVIPEPATGHLLLLGSAVGLLALRRRRI